jgi:hypothetical protein
MSVFGATPISDPWTVGLGICRTSPLFGNSALSIICFQKAGEVPVAREQRKLAAILAADVVGYSRQMGRDENGTLACLREHHASAGSKRGGGNGGIGSSIAR